MGAGLYMLYLISGFALANSDWGSLFGVLRLVFRVWGLGFEAGGLGFWFWF